MGTAGAKALWLQGVLLEGRKGGGLWRARNEIGLEGSSRFMRLMLHLSSISQVRTQVKEV